ncbi:hypothetical protein BJ742DRAFT_794797 [Cladochytrium replicatum]|nr:hypothetical protein BJ742DRAFT_794797 [Cladochytrium replicatum]
MDLPATFQRPSSDGNKMFGSRISNLPPIPQELLSESLVLKRAFSAGYIQPPQQKPILYPGGGAVPQFVPHQLLNDIAAPFPRRSFTDISTAFPMHPSESSFHGGRITTSLSMTQVPTAGRPIMRPGPIPSSTMRASQQLLGRYLSPGTSSVSASHMHIDVAEPMRSPDPSTRSQFIVFGSDSEDDEEMPDAQEDGDEEHESDSTSGVPPDDETSIVSGAIDIQRSPVPEREVASTLEKATAELFDIVFTPHVDDQSELDRPASAMSALESMRRYVFA